MEGIRAMSEEPKDLVRVAELITLAADTARAFAVAYNKTEISAVAQRIEDAAEELARIGRGLERSYLNNQGFSRRIS